MTTFKYLLIFLSTLTLSTLSANTYTVINTYTGGSGSLREAILDANNNPGLDTIDFQLSPPGIQYIVLYTPLPSIDDPVFLDGYSQNGANASTGIKRIGISGVQYLSNNYLLVITSRGSGSTIQGLIMDGIPDGGCIMISNSDDNKILGNYMGTEAQGVLDAGAKSRYAVRVIGPALNNRIGDSGPGKRNVIAATNGNDPMAAGIRADNSHGLIIDGNFIGVNKGGNQALPNIIGIHLLNCTSPTLTYNVLSGNQSEGLLSENMSSGYLYENTVGMNAAGDHPVPNGGNGIALKASRSGYLYGNVVSANQRSGIVLDESSIYNQLYGNFIGFNATGTQTYGNQGNGIELIGESNFNTIGGQKLVWFRKSGVKKQLHFWKSEKRYLLPK